MVTESSPTPLEEQLNMNLLSMTPDITHMISFPEFVELRNLIKDAAYLASIRKLVLQQMRYTMVLMPTTLDQMTNLLPQHLIQEENLHLLSNMIILLQNYRGAGEQEFLLNFKELISINKPDLVILTETKITQEKDAQIIPTLGYQNSTIAPSERNSGGILVLWNDLDLELVG